MNPAASITPFSKQVPHPSRPGAPSSKSPAHAHATPRKRLRDLCNKLEGVFVATLMRQMRQTIWKSDFLPDGPGSNVFKSLYDLELGERVAEREGLGIAEALYSELEGNASCLKENIIATGRKRPSPSPTAWTK